MKAARRWQFACLAGLGLGITTLTGCQTWVAGMTLPSGRYLQHPPQYFPPSPAFPLQRELAAMEAQAGGQAGIIGLQNGGQGPQAPLVPPAQPAPPPAPMP